MLLTDWLKHLSKSRSNFCAPSRISRRKGSRVSSAADLSSQPETLEKRTLLSAADILLTDVSGATGFQVEGASFGGSNFGNSVRAAGDVNGDGFEDVVIGAYYENINSGTVYVLFGKSTGFSPPPDLNNLQASEGFRILGTDRSDAGTAVSGGGDINGDGFDDLVIAAPNYTRATSEEGVASSGYVVFGKSNTSDVELSSIDTSASDSLGFRLTGFRNTVFRASDSVGTGGDVNGDGFDDVVFGGKATQFGDSYIGAAYVVFGKESGFSNLDVTDINGTTGFTFTDSDRGYSSTNAYLGAAVSIGGDVNGDGLDDLIIGAPGQNHYRAAMEYDGEAYVVFGRTNFSSTPTIQVTSLNGANGFVATGLVGEQARTGRSISSGGDVNGDGIDDFVIGAPGDGYGYGTAAGRAYVVFGKTNLGSGGTLTLPSLSGSNGFVLNGGGAYDLAGSSVSITGDVNGDGFDDVIVGAPSTVGAAPSDDSYNGAAYVVFGDSNIAVPADLDALNGTNGFALLGTSASVAGRSVAIAGDLDGDGFDELLIAEPYSTKGTVTFFFGEDFDLNNGVSGDGELGNGLQKIDGSAAGTVNADQGAAADILVGGGGNDTLNADGGSDILIGGSGDDTLVAELTNFSAVPRFDGGTGVDILTGDASFSGASIDLTAIPGNRINDIEVIDLEDSATQTLTLDLDSVLAITGAGTTVASTSPFATNDAHTLTILRDSDDTINGIADGVNGWTQGINESLDGKTFEVFTQDGATVKIQSADVINGDVDGDNALTTTDSILAILIDSFSVPDGTIDARKGGSTLTAAEIRDNVNALVASGKLDVDGNGTTETTDSILVILINSFSVPDATINERKAGDSPLTAAQIRTNVTALVPPPSARPALPGKSTEPEESDSPLVPLFQAPPPVTDLDGLTVSDNEDEPTSQSSEEASNSGQNDASTDEAFVTAQIDITMGLLS